VTEKYLGKVAAADMYTVSNAFSIFEFAQRVDGGQRMLAELQSS
jgi:hypothetical protein